MGKSKIEWCDRVWNPIRGCSRISEGCRNCYAERQAARFSEPGQRTVCVEPGTKITADGPFLSFVENTPAGPRWTGKVALIPEKLDEPLRWKKPARIFVNSMSDLFHENLTDHEIARIFAVMAAASRHTFQVLTKRPERMLNFFMAMSLVEAPLSLIKATGGTWPLPNVWLGVSVEDQATADERIPLLLKTPAAKRFVSYEPALGPVDFDRWIFNRRRAIRDAMNGPMALNEEQADYSIATPLDWVIVGGESGPGARPFDVEWARATVRACKEAGVAVFMKQVGANARDGAFNKGWEGFAKQLVHDRKGGDPEEWPADIRMREFPK